AQIDADLIILYIDPAVGYRPAAGQPCGQVQHEHQQPQQHHRPHGIYRQLAAGGADKAIVSVFVHVTVCTARAEPENTPGPPTSSIGPTGSFPADAAPLYDY